MLPGPMADLRTTLKEKKPDTAAAAVLRFDLGGSPFDYRPGQYIMIDPHQFEELGPQIREREAQRGKPIGPGYFSLSSDGIDPSTIEITVKISGEGPPSMLPEFLVRRLEAGRTVMVQGPAGKYHLPEEAPSGVMGFLHLCAGSAVAPNRGMIRHALARKWPQRHLLLVQDRHEADALFRREFEELVKRHPAELRVRHLHTRSKQQAITADRIRAEAAEFLDLGASWAFVCGPNHPRPDGPGFVDRIRGMLSATLGFTPDRIRTE
jgi:ferredoxin-NADP reductase